VERPAHTVRVVEDLRRRRVRVAARNIIGHAAM
jgi:hypothetical protein